MKQSVLLVFFFVFIWHVYRAAATAVTADEATTYNEFASQPVLKILASPYNAANQVLHSWLCHMILRAIRITEFSLRVGSLLGLLFYFWAAFGLVAPSSRYRVMALCLFAINPLTIGWLPQSNGFWMATGFFLLAIRKLMLFDGKEARLSAASIAMGFAVSFYISFWLLAVMLVLLFLHFEYWGPKRISVPVAMNRLILPAGLIVFCFWSLPLVKATGTVTLWQLLPLPNRFSIGPESSLPQVARELRDDLRRNSPRPIRVTADPSLIAQLNFYRRRYALGAVEKVSPISTSPSADYSVILDPQTGRAVLIHLHTP